MIAVVILAVFMLAATTAVFALVAAVAQLLGFRPIHVIARTQAPRRPLARPHLFQEQR